MMWVQIFGDGIYMQYPVHGGLLSRLWCRLCAWRSPNVVVSYGERPTMPSGDLKRRDS